MLPCFLLVSSDGRSQFRSDVLLTFWFAVLNPVAGTDINCFSWWLVSDYCRELFSAGFLNCLVVV